MTNERALRSNNFDFLRLALAVLVIFSHSYPLVAGSELHEPLHNWTRGQVTEGGIAVDLFFVMSGFLITASAERSRSVFVFLKKRVQRIYPAFIACALLMLLVVAPLASATLEPLWRARLGDFLLQTLRLTEFHYTGAFLHNPYPRVIDGSVWSIQYEFWCYIGIAGLLALGTLRNRTVMLIIFLASVGVSIVSQWRAWAFGGKFLGVLFGSPEFWARLLPLYLAGVVFYLFRERIQLSARGALIACAALVWAARFTLGWTALFPFAGTYVVFYIAFAQWLPLQRFGRFGDFSYGTYLYAFPIEQLVMQAFGHRVAPFLLFACATPLTLLVAVASWYGVERRFLGRSRRKETIVEAVQKEQAEEQRSAIQTSGTAPSSAES